MTNTYDVETLLREVADLILQEPDLATRAEMVGTFRKSSTRIGQELLGSTGYLLRDQRVNLNHLSTVFRARRSTINNAVIDYAEANMLPIPRGFRRSLLNLETDQVVTLPARKARNQPGGPHPSR